MIGKSDTPIFAKYVRLISALILSALIISACQPAAAPPAALPAAAKAANLSEPTLSVASDPKLGQILVGDQGMTLYIFTKDEPGKSNCDAACLKKWPPLLIQGSPVLGAGVDASLIGTATLADGSKIVTYNQMPLYYFVNDAKPGDTTGQGVGEVWYVLSPAGAVVQPQAANPSNSNSNDNSSSNNNSNTNDDKGYDY
jgi:predicted lipoprotein with Yx(FWY)xxD motif